MKKLKFVGLATHRDAARQPEPPEHSGISITQPDMTLGIATLLERSKRGMEIQGLDPVFLERKFDDLVGFENLSKIEKIEFTRKYKKYAEDQVKQMELKIEEAKKAEQFKENQKEVE